MIIREGFDSLAESDELEDDIITMLKDSMNNAKEDMDARMLKEQQVDASRVHESVSAAVAQDGARLLNTDELNAIHNALANLLTTSQTNVVADIEKAIAEVDKNTATFAERRMDSSIRTALAGHSVDEV
jgi:molecular chaperone HscA